MKLRVEAMAKWVGDDTQALAPAEILPPRERRRSSRLTRALADVYSQLLQDVEKGARCATVFASCYGEIEILLPLLEQVLEPQSDVSPLRFSTSVHNAASGRLAIITGDRGFSTSIAAGPETIAAAWTEAVGLIAAGWPRVAVVVGEELVQPPLGGVDVRPFAAGLLLSAREASSDTPSAWVELVLGPDATSLTRSAYNSEPFFLLMDSLEGRRAGKVDLVPGRWHAVVEFHPHDERQLS